MSAKLLELETELEEIKIKCEMITIIKYDIIMLSERSIEDIENILKHESDDKDFINSLLDIKKNEINYCKIKCKVLNELSDIYMKKYFSCKYEIAKLL